MRPLPRRMKRRPKNIDRRVTNRVFRVAALLCACAVFAMGGQSGGKKKAEEASAIIEGSVFRVPGFALPDATVTLTLRDDPKAKKLAQGTTNYRGEFLFHVPATAATYVVKASAKGYRLETKEAAITGMDRIEVTFNLEPEVKK